MSPQTETTDTKDTFIVVMPTLNEVSHIEETILTWALILRKFPGSEILVIDKSSDGTREKLLGLRKKLKLLNVVEQKGVGHGNALIQGYNLAIKSIHTWVVQVDSDVHFSPKDFYNLWQKSHKSSFIIGHRQNRKDPRYRIFLTWLIHTWIKILYGHNIKDANIPFRLIKKDYLEIILSTFPIKVFAPNIFLSILAARDGQKLYHIPVMLKSKRKKSSLSLPRLFKTSLVGIKEFVDFRRNYY